VVLGGCSTGLIAKFPRHIRIDAAKSFARCQQFFELLDNTASASAGGHKLQSPPPADDSSEGLTFCHQGGF